MLIGLTMRWGATLILMLLASCGGGGGGGGVGAQPLHALTVSLSGSGTVLSSPPGIDCGADCSEPFLQGASITLTSAPSAGWRFGSWTGGECPGTGTCLVVVAGPATVTATFLPITHELTVAAVGNGAINSTPTGITCPSDCDETYAQGTAVMLAATPSAGHQFTGWSDGGCSGSGSGACIVTMSVDTPVVANFAAVEPNTQALNVIVSGPGLVSSTPTGILCGADCARVYPEGTAVTLIATPNPDAVFEGWGGGVCAGIESCVVTMNATSTVTARFAPLTRILSVTKAGAGAGTVSSVPAGIGCGSDCNEAFVNGTAVTLTALPNAGSTFSGWSGGGCAGMSTCVVSMNKGTTVVADFAPITHVLSLAVNGAGGVGSSPSGITCPSDCTEAFALGAMVTLAAAPSTGYQFTGWSGACTGAAMSCVLTMNAAEAVTATFTPITYLLTVAKTGAGTANSVPAGISCGADCSEAYGQGTSVTLTATPSAGSTFSGWSGGGCAGTASTCQVALAAATTVTVNFNLSTVIGLSSRPNNLTCLSFDPPTTSTAGLTLQRAFVSLPAFTAPVAMLQAPNDSTRWFVVEKGGVVRVFANNAAVMSTSVFVNVSTLVHTAGEEEAGLLGMAFDPNFGTGAGKNQNFYLFYSGVPNFGYRLRSTVSRFTANAGLTSAPVSSEVKLIGLDKLESNHNGGNIAFGPDGYLYIGFGDGGGDPNPEAQDDRFLFGKMARINTAGTTGSVPYSIPTDNPNAGTALCNATGRGSAACPEVWARGLRNPWRWSFDKLNGRLWVGDVGWGSFEEVNIVTRGGNYGWPITEGAACVNAGCNMTGLINPVHAVARSDGQAITGGHVYRGTQTTDLTGQYVFGDFASKLFGAVIAGTDGTYTGRQLIAPYAASSINVSSFGAAHDGEMYALDYVSGHIHWLIFSSGSGSSGPVVPGLLSGTGCVSASDPTLPATGLVGYDINAPFWSDNAVKERFLALPSNSAAFTPAADGDWSTPLRSVFVKHFRLGAALIETRLLMRQSNGDWAGYSYEWNDAQTDASLVGSAGKEKTIGSQVWPYPSRSQCLQCHTSAAGFSLGLETQQMNRNFTYAQTGISAHQLTTLSAAMIAMLTPQITNPGTLPALASPHGSGSLDLRARAYLHTNCAMCHQPGGSTPVSLNLDAATALPFTNTCNVDPTKGNLGLANAKIIAPGAPDSSVLLARMNTRDPLVQMPPIGSHIVDANGVALLRQWISGLANCN